MDSNRHHMDISYLFPEKQVRVIPCGSVERARTIINYPRFFDTEAILIHTGTNDLEDDSLSSRHIANTLTEISETALNKFPNSKVQRIGNGASGAVYHFSTTFVTRQCNR